MKKHPLEMTAGEHRRVSMLVTLGIPVMHQQASLEEFPAMASIMEDYPGFCFVYNPSVDKATRATSAVIMVAHSRLILSNQVGLRSVAQTMSDARITRSPLVLVEKAITDPTILSITSLQKNVIDNIFPSDLQRIMWLLRRRLTAGKTTLFATNMRRAEVESLFSGHDMKGVVAESRIIKV